MTSSPELIAELRGSRPTAPAALRSRVRELAADPQPRLLPSRLRLRRPRAAVAAIPVGAAVLALAAAGIVGLAHPNGSPVSVAGEPDRVPGSPSTAPARPAPDAPPRSVRPTVLGPVFGAADAGGGAAAPGTTRAQRVTASLTVEVADSDGVSRASQDALDLVRSLGGYVVGSTVTTGDSASATLTVRVPTAKVQQAISGLSGLGKLTSQQVAIDDLQESLDTLARRATSLRSQIVGITARLESPTLDPVTRARLEARRRALRSELRTVRRTLASTNAEARLATLQLGVVTPASSGVVPTTSRLDRTLDGAVSVLAWEGVVALAIAVAAAPIAIVLAAVWSARRLYRRRETEKLLAT